MAVAFIVVKRDSLWNDSLSSMSPIAKESLALDEQLRRDMGAPDVRYMLVLNGSDEENVLQQSEALAPVMRELVARGMLEAFDAPPLPSRKAQLARQAALPGELELRRNMNEALRGMPFRSGTFAPFGKEVAAAKQQALLDRTALRGTALGLKLDTFLVQRDGGWSVMLPLRGVKDAAGIEQGIPRRAKYGASR